MMDYIYIYIPYILKKFLLLIKACRTSAYYVFFYFKYYTDKSFESPPIHFFLSTSEISIVILFNMQMEQKAKNLVP